jgi:hypothetical protein
METSLRPLTLGEILDRTAQLYRSNFVLFAGIFAVTNGVVLILVMLATGLSPAYRAMQTVAGSGKMQPGVWVFLAVFGLVGVLSYGASTAAITRAVAWVNLGERATIRSAYATTLPRLGRYLWLITLAFLIILGFGILGLLALGIVLMVVGVIVAVLANGMRSAAMVGFVAGILIDISALAIFAWTGSRYALGIPACVVEDLKARKALRRSVELSKGSRGRIFLLLLLVGVIQAGLYLVTQIPFYLYVFRHHLQMPLGLNILSQIISVATNTFVGPILAAGLTLFYFDQRVRKEGYDIEWMMQAAGMVPAGSTETAASGPAELPAESGPEALAAETPGNAYE